MCAFGFASVITQNKLIVLQRGAQVNEGTQAILMQSLGALIVISALFQVMLLMISTLKTRAGARRLLSSELKLLDKKVEFETLRTSLAKAKTKNSWSGYRKFSIDKKEFHKKSGICSFYLVPHDGKSIPAFEPGQYLFFRIAVPGQPKAVLRCYSLSDSPFEKSHYRISVKKSEPPRDKPDAPSGILSTHLHDNLNVGDIVDVRAPSGQFTLDLSSHRPVVLIGGGVGITPVLSMLNALHDMNSQREVWFFLGVRSGEEHIMEEHLQKLSQTHENFHIQICYSSPTEQDRVTKKFDHAARVNIDLLKTLLPSNNYEFYFCGPPPMMDALEVDLKTWGVPETSINFERFVPPSVPQGKKIVDSNAVGIPIKFSRSNKSLTWSDNGSILDLALENGINIDYVCKEGKCGSCQVTVKSGEVYYDQVPDVLDDIEDGMCLACVAKTKDALELDA